VEIVHESFFFFLLLLFLGVLHSLAWAENTLWAVHVCLSAAFFATVGPKVPLLENIVAKRVHLSNLIGIILKYIGIVVRLLLVFNDVAFPHDLTSRPGLATACVLTPWSPPNLLYPFVRTSYLTTVYETIPMFHVLTVYTSMAVFTFRINWRSVLYFRILYKAIKFSNSKFVRSSSNFCNVDIGPWHAPSTFQQAED
jgi:hypothetical protein